MKRTGIVTGAVLAGALLAAGPALANNPGPIQINFTTGMFGLALGQVARINAVNITRQPGATQFCVAEMDFLDADGVSVRPQPKLHDLEPGHSAFLDQPFDELPFRAPVNRVMVRATVRATCQSLAAPNPGPGPVRLSLEVFDAETGRASVMISAEHDWMLVGRFYENPGPNQ